MFLALVFVLVVVGLVAYAILSVVLEAVPRKATAKPTARRRPLVYEQGSTRQLGDGSARRRETPEQATNTKRQDALAKDAEKRIRIDLLGRGFTLEIVGESFRQESLRRLDGGRLAGGVTVAFTALVVPDPDNPFSKSAHGVMVAAEGFGPIGHLSEDEAKRYRSLSEMLLGIGAVGACPGWLVGGYGEAQSIGARLSIMSPEEILGTVQERAGTTRRRASAPTAV